MGYVYKPFDRMYSLKPTYGSADAAALMDISGDRLDQSIFPFDQSRLDHFTDGATTYITNYNLRTRLARDMAIDADNPREELPKEPTDKLIDTIANLNAQQPDMSHPADYEASTSAEMYREAKKNAKTQDNLFISGKGDLKLLDADLPMKTNPTKTLGQIELYSHEGRTNRLQTDEDGAYLNSIESISAF